MIFYATGVIAKLPAICATKPLFMRGIRLIPGIFHFLDALNVVENHCDIVLICGRDNNI